MQLLASLFVAGAAVASNAAVAVQANAPPSTMSCSTIQHHADYKGNDIRSIKRETVNDCCADCAAAPDCVVAVWYEGTCWLKNVVGTRTLLGNSTAVFPQRSNDRTSPSGLTEATTQSLPLKNIQAGYAYAKGHRQGTYKMVTELRGCQTRVEMSAGPIAPYHEDVTFVFRGPMDIYNIAIFQPAKSKTWSRVSSYSRTSATNLVFMNNGNPQKYKGLSPQGYATADGRGFAPEEPTPFRGRLDDGSNPSNRYGGPGNTTGVEVNIMQRQRCTRDVCKGYFDQAYGARGWSGSKVFVAKVKMDGVHGLPAIWALNSQVVRANQYGCNCRGRADPGGCGELDIAEAIQRGSSALSTHNYWLDANPSDGHDTWTTRPTNEPATFVAILDERSGVIKVLRLGGDDFAAFDVDAISADAMNALIQHPI
ncbi:hypothetical protein DYB32_003318 [Aphanomyces invadans]|uniref:glucan endo-1,3-beta-D-glucosidase n=1 Tax=Aphanomyces invadans TaxID=157072 RepID=A0A3R6YBM9_9STRA|nr:hypothetical protein DYB32_003318 [Aphanomyces invadans]